MTFEETKRVSFPARQTHPVSETVRSAQAEFVRHSRGQEILKRRKRQPKVKQSILI